MTDDDAVERLADRLEQDAPTARYEADRWRHDEPGASLAWEVDGLERNVSGLVLDYGEDTMLYMEANAWQDRDDVRDWTTEPVGLYPVGELDEAVEEAYRAAMALDTDDLDDRTRL